MFRQAPWHHYGLLALEQTQLSLRSPYLDNDFVRTVFRAPAVGRSTNNDVCLRLIAEGDADLRRIPTDRGGCGGRGQLRLGRVRQLREFQFKAEYAYDYGMPQWMAAHRSRLSRVCTSSGCSSGGTSSTTSACGTATRLPEYVRDMLLDPRTLSRPYLERKQLEAMVRAHLTGQRNYTAAIHKVLTLELLHRCFLDSR